MKRRHSTSRLRLSVAAGLCVMILGFPPAVLGQQQNSNDVISKLAETRRANFQKMGGLSMSAIDREDRTMLGDGSSGGRETFYASDGEKYRREEKCTTITRAGDKSAWELNRVSNGVALAWHSMVKGLERGYLYKVEKKYALDDALIAICGDDYLAYAVDQRGQVGGRPVTATETTIGGEEAVLVEVSADSEGAQVYRWWLLPEKGWLVARVEARIGDVLTLERTYGEFEQLPSGGWINHKAEQTTYDGSKAGKVLGRRILTITDVKEGQTFPVDYFEYKFPPGLPIHSQFIGGTAKLPADLIEDDLMHDINSSAPSTNVIGSTAAMVASVNSSEKAAAAPGKDDELPAWEVWIALGVTALVAAIGLLCSRVLTRGTGGDKPSE